MVLKVPLYLSIEGLEYDDLTLEDFRDLQENLTNYYTSGIQLANHQNLSNTRRYQIEDLKDWFAEQPQRCVQRFLEESEKTQKKTILSIPRCIDREEALEHLRKDLA